MSQEKDYTVVRKRLVMQVTSSQYRANNIKDALRQANEEQQANREDGGSDNEWEDLDDVIDYPTIHKEDVMEINEIN